MALAKEMMHLKDCAITLGLVVTIVESPLVYLVNY